MGKDYTCHYVIKGHGVDINMQVFETSPMGAMNISDAIRLAKQTAELNQEIMFCSIWAQTKTGDKYISARGGDYLQYYPVTGKVTAFKIQ